MGAVHVIKIRLKLTFEYIHVYPSLKCSEKDLDNMVVRIRNAQCCNGVGRPSRIYVPTIPPSQH